MKVKKRSGGFEDVNLDKITKAVGYACVGLDQVDPYQIAIKTVGGMYDGVTTAELDLLSIQTAIGFIAENPEYSRVASRLLSRYIDKEVSTQDIESFSQSVVATHKAGLVSDEVMEFVQANKRKLNYAIKPERNDLFDYYGIRTVYDRYLLKHPQKRTVQETPQYFFMRVSCGLAETVEEAIELYNLISSLEYMASTPTLFNSGTRHSQMSSCYLLDSPLDDLIDIEKRRSDIALLSKWAGGIGLSYTRVRGSGSLIKGTNGKSNGIVPFLHSLSSNVAAVNQGGKRKGAACVYLDTWHPDILEFLELRDNTGDREKRAYNLNLANWIPDLFMKRVKEDGQWSMFDPSVAPQLTDLFGDAFEAEYIRLEDEGKFTDQVPARKIYARMMKTLAETGNGWMTFKDTCNTRCNSAVDGYVVHSSNLCTEIVEPTFAGKKERIKRDEYTPAQAESSRVIGYDATTDELEVMINGEVAVCNLGSVNLAKYVTADGKVDYRKLRKNVAVAVKFLDRVIDRNFYPVPEAKNSNNHWRPVGLGLMGWQDMLFQLRLPFDSQEAIDLAAKIQEEIYFVALKTSCELAKKYGAHRDFAKTHVAQGKFQFELANSPFVADKEWNELREEIKTHGLRNSLLIAVAPTATISGICGANECIEPQISNIFKRETLSGEFITVNKYLIQDLKDRGIWNTNVLGQIRANDGSIQDIAEVPNDLKELYKTAWEIKQRALVDQAVSRGWFVDQAQSLNLFMRTPEIEKMSAMYMYAWEKGIKTTYYLRSKPATSINKIAAANNVAPVVNTENPDVCESCT
jgi:ribonucleoside-diphosphate reductase alpha chain